MEFFNTKKKFLSCKWLEHGIIFDYNNLIRVCCEQSHEGGGRYILQTDFDGENIDWEDIFKQKKNQRKLQREGKVFEKCKNCHMLEVKDWDDEDYINTLLLTHWTDCNSRCIYCPAIRDDELAKTNRHYSIISTIKNMMKKNILKKDSQVDISGGEALIYPEFEELLNLLLDYGIKNILINTSGIKFSPLVENGISAGKIKLVVSLDAGNKTTHKMIKLTDSFDVVTANLKKYAKAQNGKNDEVISKYIILPGINDNKEEIDAWLALNRELGIKSLALDIDILWYSKNKKNIPLHIYQLLKYTKKQAKKLGFNFVFWDRAFILRPKKLFSIKKFLKIN